MQDGRNEEKERTPPEDLKSRRDLTLQIPSTQKSAYSHIASGASGTHPPRNHHTPWYKQTGRYKIFKKRPTVMVPKLRNGAFQASIVCPLKWDRKYGETLVRESDADILDDCPGHYFFFRYHTPKDEHRIRKTVEPEETTKLFAVDSHRVMRLYTIRNSTNSVQHMQTLNLWSSYFANLTKEQFTHHTFEELILIVGSQAVLHHDGFRKLELLDSKRVRPRLMSGVKPRKIYDIAESNEARKNYRIAPLELLSTKKQFRLWHQKSLSDLEQMLAQKRVAAELGERVKKFIRTNSDWVTHWKIPHGFVSRMGSLPEHEYQIDRYITLQKPFKTRAIVNEFQDLPGWVGHAVHPVRAVKRMRLRIKGRRCLVWNNETKNTEVIRIRPSIHSHRQTSLATVNITKTTEPLEFSLQQLTRRPPSIDSVSGLSSQSGFSTATTSPNSFHHAWKLQPAHSEFVHRLDSGPPKGAETAVDLEWRLRSNAERQRRITEINNEGIIENDDLVMLNNEYGETAKRMTSNQYFHSSHYDPVLTTINKLITRRIAALEKKLDESFSTERTHEIKVLKYARLRQAIRLKAMRAVNAQMDRFHTDSERLGLTQGLRRILFNGLVPESKIKIYRRIINSWTNTAHSGEAFVTRADELWNGPDFQISSVLWKTLFAFGLLSIVSVILILVREVS